MWSKSPWPASLRCLTERYRQLAVHRGTGRQGGDGECHGEGLGDRLAAGSEPGKDKDRKRNQLKRVRARHAANGNMRAGSAVRCGPVRGTNQASGGDCSTRTRVAGACNRVPVNRERITLAGTHGTGEGNSPRAGAATGSRTDTRCFIPASLPGLLSRRALPTNGCRRLGTKIAGVG